MKRPRFPRLLASLILAFATTLAVAWGLALWAPIANGRGTVSLDGDHLQPWIIQINRPGAERFIYFEKGRVYTEGNVGPPAASSSAVACWSFATSTSTNPRFTRGPVNLPPELEEEMAKQPHTAWGVAEDRRGWPFLAFACTFIGTTAPDALYVYTIRDGVRIETPQSNPSPPMNQGGWVQFGTIEVESLADIRALPTRPLVRGLLLNSALALIAWYLILTAISHLISAAKSRFRKPAGHCPKCNYDLVGNLADGCPECGWNRRPLPGSSELPSHQPRRGESNLPGA